VISVLATDRVGILKGITSAITDLGGNIDGISQTVVARYFTVILTATFHNQYTAKEIENSILLNFAKSNTQVMVQPYDDTQQSPTPHITNRYILTIFGPDQPGVLKAVTSFLTEKNINIENWQFYYKGNNVTYIGEVTTEAKQFDTKQTQTQLKQILTPMGLTSHLQHENIFRVTNEIGAINNILRKD